MMILTVYPAFGMLLAMKTLPKTGYSQFSADAGRCQQKSDFLSVKADSFGFEPPKP